MINHHRPFRPLIAIVIMMALLLGSIGPRSAPGATGAFAAAPAAAAYRSSCEDLIAVKSWTANFVYSWDADGSVSESSEGYSYSGRASVAESGDITLKFEQEYLDGEPLYRWNSVEVRGTAANVGDYHKVTSFPGHTSHEYGYTRAVGSIDKNNAGDRLGDTYIEINPDDCTYNLSFWPTGPDGDTWEIYADGSSYYWEDDEWHIISSLNVYNEPLEWPAGQEAPGALPQVAVSRVMPVGGDGGGGGTGSGENDRFRPGQAIGNQYIRQWNNESYGADANVFWSLRPEPFERPSVTLDREFLERSIFLDDVAVDHWFDSKISWGGDSSGTHVWKAGNRQPESSGITAATTVRKTEDLGLQGTGNQPLTTQVRNRSGAKSDPQTTNLWIAPLMDWCGPVSGVKSGPAVSYRCGFKVPEPAFQANVMLPSWVPWFGGNRLGIRETQASMDLEAKSSGEGTLKGAGQTGFEVMGATVFGSLAGKGDIFLGPDGVRIPSGSVELTLGGKVEKEEPLIKAVPAFLAAMAWLEGFNRPAAQWLARHAAAKLEVEVKVQSAINFETRGGELALKNGEAQPGIGFKVTTFVKLFDDLIELRAGVGGEASIAWQVPPRPDYLKQVDLKFIAFYGIKLWRFLNEGEKAWAWSSAGSGLQDLGALAESRPPTWTLMDRSYLQDADYATWTGIYSQTLIEDQQLVRNLDPLADPALAATADGSQFLIWSHDKPGSPALSGQELAFARGTAAGWGDGWTQLTDDQRADFNPQIVALRDGRLLALWQRLDTATPEDINVNPNGFFSHFQIAAGVIDPATATLLDAPLQLSTSGGLNHRPSLGALGDGALAVWVANPANQIIGDATAPDRVMWARYSAIDEEWSQPATLIDNAAGLLNLRLATVYDHETEVSRAALVYAVDRDGDLETDDDQELFAIQGDDEAGAWDWKTPRQITDNAAPDSEPQITLDPAGSPLLVWRQADALQMLAGDWNAAPQTIDLGEANPLNLRLVAGQGQHALVWQQVDGGDTRIGYAIYDDAHATWSDPRTVQPQTGSHSAADTSAAVTAVAPALTYGSDGRPLLAMAYQLADVKAVTRTLEGITAPNVPELGAHHLRVASVPITQNLQVVPADLRALPAGAEVGQPVQIEAVVRNTGLGAIEGATVRLIRESLGNEPDLELGQQPLPLIAAGGAATVTFDLIRPERADYSYRVKVNVPDEARDIAYDDNEATLGMELRAETISTIYTPGAAVAQVRIDSVGALPTTAPQRLTLTRDAPDGPLLHETWFSLPLTGTASITVPMSVLPADVGPGQHRFYWNVDPGATLGERDRYDNVAATLVVMQPDLSARADLVEFGRQPGSTAPLRLRVRNEGGQASAPGTIGVYSAAPGQPGSRLLATLPLPAIQPGAIAEVAATLSLTGQPEASTGIQTLAIVLDPADDQAEINENNNLIVVGEPFGAAVWPQSPPVYLPLVRR